MKTLYKSKGARVGYLSDALASSVKMLLQSIVTRFMALYGSL